MRRGPTSVHRTVNVKLLIVLGVSLGLFGVGVHFLHAFQVKRNAGALKHQAERAEERKDFKEAARYYAHYLGFVPTDNDARLSYGHLLVAEAKKSKVRRAQERAYLVLDEVLRREPNRHEVRRELAVAALELGQTNQARDHLLFLLKDVSPDDGELEQLLGRVYFHLGEHHAAADAWARAICHSPGQLQSYAWLAGLLHRQPNETLRGNTSNVLPRPGEAPPADQIMEAMIGANPQSPLAYLVRWQYRREFKLPGAADDLARALALAPKDADVLAAAGEWYLDQRDFPVARAHLELGTKEHPKDRRMYQGLATVEMAAGQLDRAREVLQQGLDALPADEQPMLQGALADLLIEAGRLDEAEKLLVRLRKSDLGAVRVSYLEARLLIQRQDWGSAAGILERIRPEAGGDPTLGLQVNLALGLCYQQLANPELQLSAYRQALALSPLSTHARLGLAGALLAAGNYKDAVNEYRLVGASVPNGSFLLGRALVLQNLHLPADRRDWSEAEHRLREAQQETPDSVDVALYLSEVRAAQNDFASARQLLEDALPKNRTNALLWSGLVALAQRQHGPEAVPAVLDRAQKELGDTVEMRLLRAQFWGQRGGAEARAELTRLAQGADKLPPPDRARLLSGLASAYANMGESREAERLWREVAAAAPGDLATRVLLFDQAVRAGDLAALERLVQEIRKIEGPGGVLWRYAEAARILNGARRQLQQAQKENNPSLLDDARRQLSQARHLLAEVTARRQHWGRVPVLEAEIALLENSPDRAIDNYQRALKLGERGPEVVRPLVQLLYQKARFAEAEDALSKLQGDPALLGGAEKLRAEMYRRRGDMERALEEARKTAEHSKDFNDHIWLGTMYWTAGKKIEAEVALRGAVRMAEKEPQGYVAYVALVNFLARTNRKSAAEDVIKEMEKKLSRTEYRLALGPCLRAVASEGQAERAFLDALSENPNDTGLIRNLAAFYLDSQPSKAEPELRKIIASAGATPDEKAWARRHLAGALAVGITYPRYQEALRLLDQNLKEQGNNLEDTRARAFVLAAWPGQRREAIRLFEEVDRREELSPAHQYRLAQLYEAAGDWPRASARLQRLLESGGSDNPIYLASYANGLVREGELKEAAALLTKLKKLEPQSLRTLSVEARLLKAEKRTDTAIERVRAYAQGKDAALLAALAVLMEEIDPGAADDLFRAQVRESKRAESVLALVGYLGRRARVSEALDECEQVWGQLPPEPAAAACVAALYAAPDGDKHCGRAIALIGKASPQTQELKFYLANVYRLQGDFDRARQLYEELLKQDPNGVTVRSNLAWLLAMHFNRGKEALALLDEAIRAAGPLPMLLDTRSAVYLKMEQPNEAARDVQANLAEAPTALRHFRLARAHLMKKEKERAQIEWLKAKETGLAAATLDRLERPMYQKLAAALGDG